MNQTVKKLWTEALRSGRFKQGVGSLATVSGPVIEYCCLGVLCMLAVDAKVISNPAPFSNSDRHLNFGGNEGTLPEPVIKWAQVSDCDPSVTDRDLTRGLSEFNDQLRYDFNRIADLIDSNDL